jgi:RNA polymerase sigma-70 factor (ECF subfamily)
MDCTQEVFAHLSHETLPTACINGTLKLRVLLQREVMDRISSRHQHAMRQKRGAGAEHVSWDVSGAEERYQAEDSISSPETVFDRQWARATLDRCMELLVNEHKGKDIRPLLPFLNSSAEGDEDYAHAAKTLGQTQDATRQQVRRLKNRYKELLKLEVARTLSSQLGSDPTAQEILDELKALSAAL